VHLRGTAEVTPTAGDALSRLEKLSQIRLVGLHYVYRWDTTAVGSCRVVRLDAGQTDTVDIGVR